MTCDRVRSAIETWNPLADLDDDVVGHVDRCPSCREVFDTRFPSPVARRSRERGVPTGERRHAWLDGWATRAGVVALAAAALLAVIPQGGTPDLRIAAVELQQCNIEPWHPPECPTT